MEKQLLIAGGCRRQGLHTAGSTVLLYSQRLTGRIMMFIFKNNFSDDATKIQSFINRFCEFSSLVKMNGKKGWR